MSFHRVWPGVLLALLGLLLTTSPASAQFGRRRPPATAITGGTVHTGTGDVIENGVVLIQGDKIVAVGAGIPIPDGMNVIDATGRHVFPGLIDADSTLLMDPASRGNGSANPSSRIRDAVDLFQPYAMDDALAQGVTAVHMAPHNGLVDGEGAVLKLKPGASLEDLLMVDGGSVAVRYGSIGSRASVMLRNFKSFDTELSAARKYIEAWDDYEEKLDEYKKELEKIRKEEGEDEPEEPKEEKKESEGEADKPAEGEKKEGEESPDRRRRRGPPDRSVDSVPDWLAPYVEDPPRRRPTRRGPPSGGTPPSSGGDEKKDDSKSEGPKKPKKPAFDPKKEVLRKVLEGELGVFARAYGAADILNLLDLQKKHRFRMTLAGAREAGQVAAELKAAKVAVVLAQNAITDDKTAGTAAALAEAGVPFAIASAGNNGAETRFLSLSGSAAVAGGLDAGHALKAMTSHAAKIVGVADRVGSLQQGMDADVVIASGPPLSSASVVERVLVDGQVVFER